MDPVALDILLTLLFLGLAIPVAAMAKENGRDMWLSVVISLIFTPIVSLIVYLILGKKRSEKKKRQSLRSRPTSKQRQPRGSAKVRNRKAAA